MSTTSSTTTSTFDSAVTSEEKKNEESLQLSDDWDETKETVRSSPCLLLIASRDSSSPRLSPVQRVFCPHQRQTKASQERCHQEGSRTTQTQQ
jgi:hypothetical protein